MSCSRSVSLHLLRGLGAVLLVIAAFSSGAGHPVLFALLLTGAVALLAVGLLTSTTLVARGHP